MWVERRSPAFRPWKQVNSKGEEPVPKEKSFDIPKQLVWDAYQRVKANRGAAGVDGESLTMFEKNLKKSGVLDVEGAFYKYVGDYQAMKFSFMALASYLLPGNKFQPLFRIQQAKFKDDFGGNNVSMWDTQIGYLIDGYSTRMALGFAHSTNGSGSVSNALFAGLQLQK